MKRTWAILIISIIVLILSFIFFIFPGYYFTYESKKAESTPFPSSTPPLSLAPSSSTGSSTPTSSGSSEPSPSQSGSSKPSVSITASPSGLVSISPTATQGMLEDIFYCKKERQGEIKSLSSKLTKPIKGVAAAVAVALIVSPFLSFLFNFPFRDLFYFFFSSLFEFLGIRKRRRPWGIVYDSLNKRPIEGAVVKVVEADSGRVRDISVSDREGRFGFLINKGKYRLTVAKAHYQFPSKKTVLDKKGSDGYFADVYLGSTFLAKEAFLSKNIPVDPKIEATIEWPYLLFLRYMKFFGYIRIPLLILGTILAIVNLYLFRSILDIIILSIYLLTWFFEILERQKVKPYGEVLGEEGETFDLAVVRFFREKDNKLVATTVTNKKGRFFVLMPEGDYYLTASKSGYFLSVLKNIHISKANPREIKIVMKKSERIG